MPCSSHVLSSWFGGFVCPPGGRIRLQQPGKSSSIVPGSVVAQLVPFRLVVKHAVQAMRCAIRAVSCAGAGVVCRILLQAILARLLGPSNQLVARGCFDDCAGSFVVPPVYLLAIACSSSTTPGLLLLLLLHQSVLWLLAKSPSTVSARPARLPARTHLASARAAECTSG